MNFLIWCSLGYHIQFSKTLFYRCLTFKSFCENNLDIYGLFSYQNEWDLV